MNQKQDKERDLAFYKDGYTIASNEIIDFNTLTPLFKAMQTQYSAIGNLIQSFAVRTHQENKPIKCEKGCSWCCYQPVYLTSQEAILIYEFMLQAFDQKQIEAYKSKAEAKFKKTKGLKEEDKQKIKHACPFLVDGSCSIYSVRPMACRIYLSSDASTCKNKYDNPGDDSIVPALYDFVLKAGKYMNEGFVGFLKGKGRKMEELTVEEFMVRLFNNKEFYKQWLVEDNLSEENQK